jgi:hypothetical protein
MNAGPQSRMPGFRVSSLGCLRLRAHGTGAHASLFLVFSPVMQAALWYL